jgi:hypothetical protein
MRGPAPPSRERPLASGLTRRWLTEPTVPLAFARLAFKRAGIGFAKLLKAAPQPAARPPRRACLRLRPSLRLPMPLVRRQR